MSKQHVLLCALIVAFSFRENATVSAQVFALLQYTCSLRICGPCCSRDMRQVGPCACLGGSESRSSAACEVPNGVGSLTRLEIKRPLLWYHYPNTAPEPSAHPSEPAQEQHGAPLDEAVRSLRSTAKSPTEGMPTLKCRIDAAAALARQQHCVRLAELLSDIKPTAWCRLSAAGSGDVRVY